MLMSPIHIKLKLFFFFQGLLVGLPWHNWIKKAPYKICFRNNRFCFERELCIVSLKGIGSFFLSSLVSKQGTVHPRCKAQHVLTCLSKEYEHSLLQLDAVISLRKRVFVLSVCLSLYVCMCVCVFVFLYMCVCVCMCACVFLYVCVSSPLSLAGN